MFTVDLASTQSLATVGGKGLGLAHLIAAGLDVPPGFVITTDAYRAVVALNSLQPHIDAALEASDPDAAVRLLFAEAALPEGLAEEIGVRCAALGPEVAVRSSATAEDLPTASFAGQQDTVLGVTGPAAVMDAVRRCWASVWNSHAVAYRTRALTDGEVAIAVVVQELVDADAAGVLFTADPVTGRRDHVVINAAWGLGEALVGGEVTPDHLVLDRAGVVLDRRIAEKTVMTVRTASGTATGPVPEELRGEPVLSDADVAALRGLARAVEAHFGAPMDVEWARREGRIAVLQARPITALPPDLLGMEWSREMLIERYPDPMTPLTWSAVSGTFFDSLETTVRGLGGTLPDGVPLVRRLHGRAYVNVTALQAGLDSMPLRPPVASDADSSDAGAARRRPRLGAMASGLAGLVRIVLGTHRDWERRLPGFVAETARGDQVDWEALSGDDFLTAMWGRRATLAPMLDNHARAIVAGDLTLQLLGAITRRWLGDADGSLVLTLLSGLSGNRTVETNHELWLLAQQARRSPAVLDLLGRPDVRIEEFAEVSGGGGFVAGLSDFLARYGHRSPRYEFRHPTWRDEPQQVIGLVRLMLDGRDPLVGQDAGAARREQATADARRRLSLPVRLLFDRVLGLAQIYFRLRENQQFFLTLGVPGLRAMFAAAGRRLVDAGLLEASEDIFFLDQGDIERVLVAVPDDDLRAHTQALVAERCAELALHERVDAPLRLGVQRKRTADDPGALTGVAGSAGSASGRARLVRGPEDFASVCPGDIIVAPATTPAWTPLFGLAGGLVTEHGGLLSHSGVVAREYGLPAVLGVPDALARLHDGMIVEVDGRAGTVTVIECREGGLGDAIG